MYLYTASPALNTDEGVEPFSFTISSTVCTALPIKFGVRGENRYTHVLTLDMDDNDLDLLIKQATEAKAKRTAMKVATLEQLVTSEYDAGTLSMETAERMQYLAGAVLADRETDPDSNLEAE